MDRILHRSFMGKHDGMSKDLPKQFDWYVQPWRPRESFGFGVESSAKCVVSAIGVDNRVASCGDGHFCCWENSSENACCSTSSTGVFLGLATVMTTITASSAMPASTDSGSSLASMAASTNLGGSPASAAVSIAAHSKSAVTKQGSSPSATNAAATSNTQAGTSKFLSTPTPSGVSGSHVAIGIGAGVGVPVGLAILAGFFYLMRRHRSKRRPEGPPPTDAAANGEGSHSVHELWVEKRYNELSSGSKWPRAELDGTHGTQAEKR